jgi:3-deoxy-D-manno-octulosonic-acid transferase
MPRFSAKGRGGAGALWVHALSVGEALSAVPLAAALCERYPRHALHFSTATATGLSAARDALAGLPVRIFPAPFDFPPLAVRRLLSAMAPSAVILVETDLWPNLPAAAAARGIPVALANARVSDRSYRRYRNLPALARRLYGGATAIGVQTPRDRDRMRSLGIGEEKIRVTGNIKFDQPAEPPSGGKAGRLARRLGLATDSAVIVAGSTHPGEEDLLFQAAKRLLDRGLPLKLVCAPRDPARAEGVRRLFARGGLRTVLWSGLGENGGGTDAVVVVIDRIGLLRSLYGAADVALVGGSLIEAPHLGGHNPLEPAAHAKPVVVGANMKNFRAIHEDLLAAGGAIEVRNPEELPGALERLLTDPAAARRVGLAARAVLDGCRGAVDRTLEMVEALVGRPDEAPCEGERTVQTP